MNIESKDVLGASTLTPTFTERTITGTARVQNNRTMLLASVSQDVETKGRSGLPVLGGLPIVGRLFTSPTRNNRRVDIVIAVTPRVLRAPALTPRDEEMRPSGTLQSPTTGSLEAMLRENYREEQILAARRIPKEVNVQLPDAPYVPPPRLKHRRKGDAMARRRKQRRRKLRQLRRTTAPRRRLSRPDNKSSAVTTRELADFKRFGDAQPKHRVRAAPASGLTHKLSGRRSTCAFAEYCNVGHGKDRGES